jgi:hypothetical protein
MRFYSESTGLLGTAFPAALSPITSTWPRNIQLSHRTRLFRSWLGSWRATSSMRLWKPVLSATPRGMLVNLVGSICFNWTPSVISFAAPLYLAARSHLLNDPR